MNHSKSLKHSTACGFKGVSKNSFKDNLREDVKHKVESCNTRKDKSSTINSPMSKYEMMLEEKRAKNREFLESLKINEIKADMMKEKKVRKVRERSDPVIQRASKRLKDHVDYVEDLRLSARGMMQKFCPTETNFKKALKYNNNSQYENFVKDFSEIKEDYKVMGDQVLYDKYTLKQLSAKVSQRISQIHTISWFPSTENLILAVGDADGNLSLSNFKGSYLDFHVFSVHSKKISHLQCNPSNPFHLVSSGMDGKVVCCDLQAEKFKEVINIPGRGCTDFDFISPSSYIVSLTTGDVIIHDSRKCKTRQLRYSMGHTISVEEQTVKSLHQHSIHSINVHPINKDYFVTTCGREKNICIWDLRKLRSPVINYASHKRIVSADFSPASGKFLLAKSDDEIELFDCTSMTRRHMEYHKTMKGYDLKTHYCSRPVWLPNSDENFACNINHSSLIYIFDKDLNIYETLSVDEPPGTKNLFAFHPSQTALAAFSTGTDKIGLYL